ncbi:MAG: ABC transporter permease, partial [Anaerolineales bacterium]|nr:ABC transporter permease [Anaerolineales bacterium]
MDITGIVSFTRLVVLAMVPYILAAQGTMLAGRTGVFNVAQEGIMLVGASVGFLAAFNFGGLGYGLLVALLVGGLFGLALSYFTTTLKLDQFVIGLGLFFIGLALSTLLFKLFVGVTLEPPIIPTLQRVPIPGLASLPILGPILFQHNIMVYASIVLSAVLYWFLYHTAAGLELRSVGENPKAADSLGVNVALTRYLTSIVGGMLIGLAGAYLPMVYTGTFTAGIASGRGWIAIALAFFGGWTPHWILVGSLVFAAVEVLALRVQVGALGLPHQFLRTLPYLATIAVMVFAFRGAKQP